MIRLTPLSPLPTALLLAMLALTSPLYAAEPVEPVEPLGIAMEEFRYPYPVQFLPVVQEREALRMAYMDVPPAPSATANGRAVLLLHGRNFPSSYWEPTIKALAAAGYRVVVPDQIGFGKSSKPTFAYSFDALARNTATLLETLGLPQVDIVGHSIGGMLAARFTRTYPDKVRKLVLYAPIGLEDYRFYVPPVTTERLMEQERNLSADGYRRQLVANYSLTLPPERIEPFVEVRERIRASGEYERWLRSFVNSYHMIYAQPVAHEIPLIERPTLFIMGSNDHNAPGRPFAPAAVRAEMGHNADLAKADAARMKDARVEVIDGVGHLVHLEAEERFNETLLGFLGK
ncbi:MAG TPA: alpha/beta hydrolase [Stellaceae bacterium]